MSNTFYEQAIERLQKEQAQVVGVKEKAMAKAVRIALEDFCRQDSEFAEAVANGESFNKCMEAVAKGVGGSISDAEAFRKAAQFYFKGCEVRVILEIDVCPNRVNSTAAEQKDNTMRLELIDLDAFF